MGISNGSIFYELFQRGLYKKKPKTVRIHFDGENMWYKGQISAALTSTNPESQIAMFAENFVLNLKLDIENLLHLSHIPNKDVFIWMDGERSIYKETRHYDFKFNKDVARSEFKERLKNQGFQINQLISGESELIMYHDRNIGNDLTELNVFVTNDSDMFSICYNHYPKIKNEFDVEILDFDFSKLEEFNSIEECIHISQRLNDLNSNYSSNLKVYDSCVWVSTNSGNIRVIGMDGVQERIKLKPKVFNVLTVMCGNDYFRQSMLSKSCLNCIMNFLKNCQIEKLYSKELEFINSLNDPIDICVAFLYISVKKKGTLVRKIKEFESVDLILVNFLFYRYYDYIHSKSMYFFSLGGIKASNITHFFLLVMMDYHFQLNSKITSKERCEWVSKHSIQYAVENFRKNIIKLQPDYEKESFKFIDRLENLKKLF